jgi:hypothetical protein
MSADDRADSAKSENSDAGHSGPYCREANVIMRNGMGHARRETAAFRQRRAADTVRWRRLNHSAGDADLLQLRKQLLHLRRGVIGHLNDEF